MTSYLSPLIKPVDLKNKDTSYDVWMKIQRKLANAHKALKNIRRKITLTFSELNFYRYKSVGHTQKFSVENTDLRKENEKLAIALASAIAEADSANDSLLKLTWTSQHDPLTNVPNRTLMLDRITKSIAVAQRNNTYIALLFVDIDHFKSINDTLGHEVGDGVLQLVARRLESCVRNVDTVSRHGGDEFLVLLTDLKEKSDMPKVADKILSTINEPAKCVGHQLNFCVSIGAAFYPDSEFSTCDAGLLIRHADIAMYSVKKRGGNCLEIYT